MELKLIHPKNCFENTLAPIPKQSALYPILLYLSAAALSLFLGLSVLKIWHIKYLQIPFHYNSDELFYAMTIKSVTTTGWYLTNPMIGAPEIHSLYDFPTPEGLNYLLIKCLSFFTSDWALIQNLFFLLSFPLITLAALFVMKRLGIQSIFALTGSLLYSLLPFHFMRNTEHLFLSAYYMCPFAIWLSYLVYQNRFFLDPSCMHWNFRKKFIRLLPLILLAFCIGSTGVYYAYFASFFLCLSGLIASGRLKTWKPLAKASLFIVIIVGSVLFNIAPNLAYQIQNGKNEEVAKRSITETELNALKMIQLILPIDEDRLSIFAQIKKEYNQYNPPNENTTATLGFIGTIGFFYLISRCFIRFHFDHHPLNALTHLNLGGVLFGTIGGFSSLVALLILPEIRCYNRISIFLAFFALCGFFILIQSRIGRKPIAWFVCFTTLILGYFSQTTSTHSPVTQFKERKRMYQRDKAFFAQIDKSLPLHSQVFQLPYLPFPEAYHPLIGSYDHFRAPLHSKTVKWSFGAMKGREADQWQRHVSKLNASEMLSALIEKGFTGIYLNRAAHSDQERQLSTDLTTLLGEPLIQNEKACFWKIDLPKEAQQQIE